jgi:hypothetical protein
VRITRAALEDLHAKYAEMLAMRVEHARGAEDVDDVRARMAALATRFPGALRELDDLELDEIRRRLVALDHVLHSGSDAEPWMEAVALFHAMTRGALCAKRWLAGRKHVDAKLRRAYADAVEGLPFPEDARAWVHDLARIASPPGGRVSNVVLARLALELGTSARGAKRLVFGVPRRERRAS